MTFYPIFLSIYLLFSLLFLVCVPFDFVYIHFICSAMHIVNMQEIISLWIQLVRCGGHNEDSCQLTNKIPSIYTTYFKDEAHQFVFNFVSYVTLYLCSLVSKCCSYFGSLFHLFERKNRLFVQLCLPKL